jgi:hypothetical protein
MRVPVSLHSCQHLIISVFLIVTILVALLWYLIADLFSFIYLLKKIFFTKDWIQGLSHTR